VFGLDYRQHLASKSFSNWPDGRIHVSQYLTPLVILLLVHAFFISVCSHWRISISITITHAGTGNMLYTCIWQTRIFLQLTTDFTN